MKTNIRRAAAIAAASAPAAGLALVAGLSQTLYAGNDCFSPHLDLYTQTAPATVSTTGAAMARLKCKPPFILEGATEATGFLDADAGVSAANAMGSASRLWTPTCSGWSYGWSATGSVVGQLKTKASKTWPGSATATCSFTATAAGDLSPAAHDARVASSSTQGGGTASISVGLAPPSVSYTIGQTSTTQTVTPSTNPAGDSKTLFDGPKANTGAGPETVVVVNLSQDHNCAAFGGGVGWKPHVCKSSATSAGYAGAAVIQDIYARSPGGLSYGMSVHIQTLSFRDAWKDPKSGSSPEYGPWRPPVGPDFETNGPAVEIVEDPPLPPDPQEREANDGTFHKED